jgi:hypothetical protein
VVLQLHSYNDSQKIPETPQALASWSLNFKAKWLAMEDSNKVASKLKYHAAEAGGVRVSVLAVTVAGKLKYHAAEAGGVRVGVMLF